VQEGHVLGGALAGPDDDEAGRVGVGQALHPGQQIGVVPDAVRTVDTLRHLGPQTCADDEVAGPVDHDLRARTGRHIDVLHDSVAYDGPYGDDLVPVGHHVVDLGRGPLEVVVELDPEREETLAVDEVDQPPLALQVTQEAELTRRIPQCHQVLEEGHLHGRVVDQHAAVPAEARLPLEEVSSDRLLPVDACIVLAERYRHGHIGRSEADSYEVVGGWCVVRKSL
jgi:hypothetical protein